jgi:hypothetical protein
MSTFVREWDEIFLSRDNYLLQKVVHSSTIQRAIDWHDFGITKEYCRKQYNLANIYDNILARRPIDKRKQPEPDNQDEMDKFYITELCHPYSPPPDENDIFVWYNDIVALSGTAGYLRIRDGYVYGQKIVWRS